MDLDEYDEYGNYIGGKEQVDTSSGNEESESDGDSLDYQSSTSRCSTEVDSADEFETDAQPPRQRQSDAQLITQDEASDQVIPSDGRFYGEEVEMVIAEEDTQQITKPLLFDTSSTVTRYFAAENASVQAFRRHGVCAGPPAGEFLRQIVKEFPDRMRTVVFLGHLHHGKTSICGCMISDGSAPKTKSKKQPAFHRLLDTRRLEHDKGISMVIHPFSCIAQSVSAFKADGNQRGQFSYVFNGIDTPGHTNFEDEALVGIAAADGAVLIVDAAEGMRDGTRRALDQIIARKLPFILVVNKMDRLVLELHLPPADAYLKLYHIVHEVNDYVATHGQTSGLPQLSPCDGNVIFGAAKENWFFSLESFASLYQTSGKPVITTPGRLARRLWGNWRYNASSNTIKRDVQNGMTIDGDDPFTFVSFILEPIYKVYATILSKDTSEVSDILHIAPPLTPAEQSMKMQELFPLCLHRIFHPPRTGLRTHHCGAVSTAIMQHIGVTNIAGVESSTTPRKTTYAKIVKFLQFPIQKKIEGEVTSSSPTFEADLFYPLVRVMHGDLSVGMKCHLMGTDDDVEFSPETASLSKQLTIDALYLIDPLHGLVHTSQAATGALVCFRGFTESELRSSFPFVKEGLLIARPEETVNSLTETETSIIQRLMFHSMAVQQLRRNQCVVKVGIEPVSSAVDYGNLVYAIRCAEYVHPGLKTIREETGERILLTLGELRMDTVLFEIREVFGRSARENLHGVRFSEPHFGTDVQPEVGVLKIRVSDPFVSFAETVLHESDRETYSELRLYGSESADEPGNRKNRLWISFLADPLSKKVQSDLSAGIFLEPKIVAGDEGVVQVLRHTHDWDAFACKSFWCFGPHPQYGPNALLNETSLATSDSSSSDLDSSESESESEESESEDEIPAGRAAKHPPLDDLRDSFMEGFRWAMSEGPLCGEPVRGVAVRLTQAKFPGVSPDDPLERAKLQRSIVPGTRKGVTSCLLNSHPCLLEPMYTFDIESTHEARDVVYALVSKRRGKVMREERRPGSLLYTIRAEVPVLDSFGLETDLRIETAGGAFAESRFSGWDVLPGGPATDVLAEIEKHPSYSLASADVDTEPVPPRRLTEDVILKTRRRKGMFTDF